MSSTPPCLTPQCLTPQGLTPPSILLRPLRLMDYQPCWSAMREFTNTRTADAQDQLWLVEHHPVFTQGQAGKAEHLLAPSDIPVVQSDRGGQVTYHGPGQLLAYPLIDLKRLNFGVRELVSRIEQSVVDLLADYDVQGAARPDAPGVYVEDQKIASLGLRVRKGCSYHGVAINIATDLRPFDQINPCGYAGLKMVNLADILGIRLSPETVAQRYASILAKRLGMILI